MGRISGLLQGHGIADSRSRLDFRLQLSATDYGNFLANEPLPLSTATIADKATEKLVSEFNYIRTNAVEPLATFLDYITYAYMIDNVILLTLGTLHERDTHELLERCHPLGVFDTMPALCVATNVEELYHSVLVETPLGEWSLGAREEVSIRSMCCAVLTLCLQRHTSKTACRRKTSTTSTLRSSETRCTKPTWRTSIGSANPSPRHPTRS